MTVEELEKILVEWQLKDKAVVIQFVDGQDRYKILHVKRSLDFSQVVLVVDSEPITKRS